MSNTSLYFISTYKKTDKNTIQWLYCSSSYDKLIYENLCSLHTYHASKTTAFNGLFLLPKKHIGSTLLKKIKMRKGVFHHEEFDSPAEIRRK